MNLPLMQLAWFPWMMFRDLLKGVAQLLCEISSTGSSFVHWQSPRPSSADMEYLIFIRNFSLLHSCSCFRGIWNIRKLAQKGLIYILLLPIKFSLKKAFLVFPAMICFFIILPPNNFLIVIIFNCDV